MSALFPGEAEYAAAAQRIRDAHVTELDLRGTPTEPARGECVRASRPDACEGGRLLAERMAGRVSVAVDYGDGKTALLLAEARDLLDREGL